MDTALDLSDASAPALSAAILVVEDDILIRTAVAGFLRDCRFDVVEAGTADEAVRVLQAGMPVDLVFTDVNMPGSMDGLDLAQWARRERPDLKVIVTSGTVQPVVRTDPGRYDLILAKPYRHADLERRIRTLLAQPCIST